MSKDAENIIRRSNKIPYIETIESAYNGRAVIESTVRKATKDDIKRFMSMPCNHGPGCKEQLIYDEPGWMYDFRYCYVCNCLLGMI